MNTQPKPKIKFDRETNTYKILEEEMLFPDRFFWVTTHDNIKTKKEAQQIVDKL